MQAVRYFASRQSRFLAVTCLHLGRNVSRPPRGFIASQKSPVLNASRVFAYGAGHLVSAGVCAACESSIIAGVKGFPDKRQVLDSVITRLQELAAQMAHHAESTREGATHAEAKPENDKDTRALEQSYLARGQAMRVEEIVEHVQVLRFLNLRRFDERDAIAAGALVEIEGDEQTRVVFMLPHGGGVEVSVDGVGIQVVTPISPLGKALLGRTVGDDFELRMRNTKREYVIARVG
jgi:transcription elongation GreA/GreB family factor